MSKLSVLLLHNTAAPYRLPLFQALARYFDLEVAFCQMYKDDRLWQVDLANYDFHYHILSNKLVRLGRKAILFNYNLVPWLLSRSYDVYVLGHGPGMLLSLLTTMLAARLKRRPVVLWSGTVWRPGQSRLPNWLSRLKRMTLRTVLYRWPAAYIAYGQRAAEYLRDLGVPSRRIFTGTQVVWPDQMAKPTLSKADLGLEGHKVVLCLSYLVKRKGIQYLIEAFHALGRDDTILVIAGDGPYRRNLKEQASSTSNIVFAGYVEGEVKASYYAAADVFILPTLFDPWPNVINEAMYFGLPIVTTNMANCPEVLGDNAIVVEPRAAALQAALAKLLDNEALRQQMGEASRRLVREYYGSRAVKVFSEAIETALALYK